MDKESKIFKTQVIIVGAGPTGLSMAAQLMRYNIDFIIIEKKGETTTLSKALVVQARTLEIFQELGIAEKAVNEGQITTALNLFHNGKQITAINLAGLGEGLSPFPYALSLEQSKTENLLVEYITANGKKINWESEFTHFEESKNGVIVYYKDNKGQEQIIEAAYLIGCDGASSVVRHEIGSAFEGDTVPKIFYVADVKLKSNIINKNELFIFLIKKGFIIFFPMNGIGHYRIIGILPNAKESDEQFKFTDIEVSIKEQLMSDVDFEEVRWFSSYKVHSRKADTFVNGRCYIAGDAAHIHTPAGGQGMNTGIQDAYNLAWKIAYTIRGKVNPNVLSSYNTERTENAKHLLKTTDRMFDIMAGTSGFWNFLRINFFPVIARLITKSKMAKKKIFPFISQTGISYPNSYLTFNSSIGRVKAGDRMPYFIFSDGKQIFEYLSEPTFKILFFGNERNNNFKKLNNLKIQIAMFAFNEIPKPIFKNLSDFYILLRPDNHISYIGKNIDNCSVLLEKFLYT
jgi:2-polyprenyl-6-methoxyphenol hydroxylase-like FAD-dependent oxidoreductase